MGQVKIDHEVLEKFAFDILCNSGIEPQEAETIAQVMVWTDMIGRSGHGLAHLPILLKRFKRKLINSPCHAKFVKKSDAIFLLEGKNGPGQFLGHQAMTKAIDTAAEYGVSIVSVRNSNHFGACAYYAQLAAEKNKISLVTSNSFPCVAPYGGISPVLGTNPFAFGAPVKDGQSILADFSTSTISGTAIREAIKDRKKISRGVALDEKGNDTVDPEKVIMGSLLPMAGFKGYSLGLMVEILSGVLTGSAISNEIGSVWRDFTKSNRVGHLFMVIDIASLVPLEIYYERIADLIGYIMKCNKKDAAALRLPGEARWCHYKQNIENGVPLGNNILHELNLLADGLGLVTPW
jgi:LDH2 family malate/lactate/ureidoglycolate dehydrogenase